MSAVPAVIVSAWASPFNINRSWPSEIDSRRSTSRGARRVRAAEPAGQGRTPKFFLSLALVPDRAG
jgi:hypothetical protein